jgi:DNA-binding MarR family transcriptional regulator
MKSKDNGEADDASSLTADEQMLWHALKALGEAALILVGREIETATQLSGADFGVLSRLEDLGNGALSQQELANSLNWHKSRLSHHLTRMESRSLLRREPSSTGRGVTVVILPAGKTAIAAARPVHASAVRTQILRHIGKSEERALLALVKRLKTAD